MSTQDQIVRWQDVRQGDQVLIHGVLVEAMKVDIAQRPWGDDSTFTSVDITHVLDNGVLVVAERHGDRMTAVRREVRDAAAT